MRIYILLIALLFNPGWLSAAEGVMPYEFSPDLSDNEALQRGARTFVNYCLSCHSASYMRYNRMGEDLGIPDDVLVENFMFGTDKVGDTMDIAMSPETGEMYFGIAPRPICYGKSKRRGMAI